mgnify:CR=1 FL=1
MRRVLEARRVLRSPSVSASLNRQMRRRSKSKGKKNSLLGRRLEEENEKGFFVVKDAVDVLVSSSSSSQAENGADATLFPTREAALGALTELMVHQKGLQVAPLCQPVGTRAVVLTEVSVVIKT